MSDPVHVFDSSAVLCAYFDEPGAEEVKELSKGALISAVNFSEVVSKLQDYRVSDAVIHAVIEAFELEIIPFDMNQATGAGKLRNKTRKLGLSFGDRACLALALTRGAVAVTTDKAWADLGDVANVKLVR